MKKMTLLVTILVLHSFSVHAESFKIAKDTPFSQNETILSPTSFAIDNSIGRIEVYEVPGNELQIRATMDGRAEAELDIQRSPGRVSVNVKYPTSATNISSEIKINAGPGSSIRMSGITIAGGVHIDSIRNGVITIGNQVINLGRGGSLTINSSSSGQVILRLGLPSSMLADLEVNSSTGTIHVSGQFLNGFEGQRKVNLATSTGGITCEGMCSFGEIKATASTGNIELENVKGRIRAEVSTGDIKTRRTSGTMSLQTSMGSVNVYQHIEGAISAESSNGDVRVFESAGQLNTKSGMGTITIEGHRTNDIIATTSMGDIVLALPDTFSPRAETRMGQVRQSSRSLGPDICARLIGKTR